MSFIADLHLHSHFSRATSPALNLENLWLWAQLKGVSVIGTGDIAHPGWLAELKQKLRPAEDGLFELRKKFTAPLADQVPPLCRAEVRFMLAGEVCNIYRKHGKTRKIHHILFLPSFAAANRLQQRLARNANLSADGRPILKLSSRDLLEILLESDSQAHLIPAHVWTPWFSLFGAKSGYDAIEECFADLTPHIFALETGLSADPPMFRQVSALDRFTLVSNSDAHSPQYLAREATIFDCERSYPAIFTALRNPVPRKFGGSSAFGGTLEFFPQEGKYHFDGHRKCNICWSPATAEQHNNICPVCSKPVTLGVLHRIQQLTGHQKVGQTFLSGPQNKVDQIFVSGKKSDNPRQHSTPNTPHCEHLIPLPEILAEILQAGPQSKRVRTKYGQLLAQHGPELTILRQSSPANLEQSGNPQLAQAIHRMRTGKIFFTGGYDGIPGKIRVFGESERKF